MTDRNRLREAALWYARLGWSVVPLHTPRRGPSDLSCSCLHVHCSSPGKHPRIRRGVREASEDVRRIAEWWRRWPDANIGLRTGVVFDAIDIDGQDGLLAFGEHQRQRISGPRVRTGNGLHILVRVTGYGNRAGVVEHVDYRGANGYIVAPPSNHASGRRYTWLPGRPGEPLPEAPEWLVDRLKPRVVERHTGQWSRPVGNLSRYGRKALDGECLKVATAPEGQWNDTTNAAAFSLGQLVAAGALPMNLVESELYSACAARGHATVEAERTIASGLAAGLRQPRLSTSSALEPSVGLTPPTLIDQ